MQVHINVSHTGARVWRRLRELIWRRRRGGQRCCREKLGKVNEHFFVYVYTNKILMDVLKPDDLEDPWGSILDDYDEYNWSGPAPAQAPLDRTAVGVADIASSTDVSPPPMASMATSMATSAATSRQTDVPELTPVRAAPSSAQALATLQDVSESSDDERVLLTPRGMSNEESTETPSPRSGASPGQFTADFSLSPLQMAPLQAGESTGAAVPSRIAVEQALSTGFAPSKTIDIAKLLLREPEMAKLVSAGLVNPQDLDTPAKVSRARAVLSTIAKERDSVAGRPALRRQRSAPVAVPRSTASRVVVQPGLRWYAPPSRSYTNA